MKLPTKSLAAAIAAVSLVTSSVASAAPAVAAGANPLVALSLFGSVQSRAALCAAGSAAAAGAAAATAVQTRPGCVLPVADAPPPVVSEAPPPVVETPYVAAAAAPGINIWPLLGALALFSGVFFLLDDEILGDEDDLDIDLPELPPVSPV